MTIMDKYPETLDDFLEEVQVMDPGMWENSEGPVGWYAVTNENGIIAYFGREADAYRFRLDYISQRLNPTAYS